LKRKGKLKKGKRRKEKKGMARKRKMTSSDYLSLMERKIGDERNGNCAEGSGCDLPYVLSHLYG
jgi:hypothetical protein